MTVGELAQTLELDLLTGHRNSSRELTGACVSDLLSYVMGTAKAGNLWLTIQVHPNIIGVVELLDLVGVVVAHGQIPEAPTIEKAREQGICLLKSRETTFALAGKLYALGVR